MRISDWSSDVCSSDLPLNDVAFPAYARMQADESMLNQSFCKAVRLILLVACPLYLGMAVVAEPLIQLLFGSKWLGMAPLVTILAASMPCYALQVRSVERRVGKDCVRRLESRWS